MSASPVRAQRYLFGALLTVAIVALTLSTAYIHSTLGGMLFTLNAIGYALLAVAIVVGAAAPWPIVVRFSWLPRVGLFGFALATIIGWMVMGPRSRRLRSIGAVEKTSGKSPPAYPPRNCLILLPIPCSFSDS